MKERLEIEMEDICKTSKKQKVPKTRKQASNLSFMERIQDIWYRLLERMFAPGCYYIGKHTAAKLPGPELNLGIMPSKISILSERKSSEFGVNINLILWYG